MNRKKIEFGIQEVGDQNSSPKRGGAVSRREFLKKAGMGAVALGLGLSRPFADEAEAEKSEERLQQYLNQGDETGDPDVSIKFFFSYHRTAEDFQKLQAYINEADVVVLEDRGWKPEILENWRKLADGKITPRQAMQKIELSQDYPEFPILLKKFEIIYNSHKFIDCVDIPDGHPVDQKLSDLSDQPTFSYDGDFEKALKSVRSYYQNYAALEKQRETYMLARLKEISKERARLEKKRELSLVSIGASHTGMFHALKREGMDASAVFSRLPFVFGFGAEMLRRRLFNKPVDDFLTAKVILEEIFFGQLNWPPTEDSEKMHRFLRKLTARFSFDEIKELFERLKDKNYDERSMIVNKWLEVKNIHWPKTEKELDDFLTPKRALKK